MPIYEYICKQCGAHGEVIQKATDAPLAICEKCGGEVYRPISRTSFQLKGGGWYKDGYGSSATKTEDSKTPSTQTSSDTSGATSTAGTSTTPAVTPAKDKP